MEAKKQKRQFQVTVYRDWCKRCGICVAFCPKSVLALNEKGFPHALHPEACIGCRLCEIRCPDFALEIKENIIHSCNRVDALIIQDAENSAGYAATQNLDLLQSRQG